MVVEIVLEVTLLQYSNMHSSTLELSPALRPLLNPNSPPHLALETGKAEEPQPTCCSQTDLPRARLESFEGKSLFSRQRTQSECISTLIITFLDKHHKTAKKSYDGVSDSIVSSRFSQYSN